MKKVLEYLKIFMPVLIVSMIITMVLVITVNNNSITTLPALVDLESGEIIRLPEFDKDNALSSEIVCLRNTKGSIIFWGEFDYNTNTLCGNIFPGTTLAANAPSPGLIGILNPSSDKIHYLNTNPAYIQLGKYHITYSSNTVTTDSGKDIRYNLTIHIHD